ncbi:MAG: hypothetical protein COX46_02010 [bacterium (Candidatus Ratteibacteria) CG23_combo_of_CG06-09_8_20_14_all_48_7]|uniref:HEPN domain-containing protein n=1 Tax=bacterium (Candidatus Ratteibacteria) CG23_combo_of_CG06-09_8_20_14_all_48_7 TaxID=2014292 RepID=A0A2G9YD75_9BACT|nr:MAG: hypothetical protein COX46_02010 [bacterium (Candidatus Ratteibacteria) CG23_combo_of_CG06-09_8_20_14_all_48_7]
MGREKNLEFLEAIEKRKILPFAQGRKLVGKEIKAAREDLKEAEDRHTNKRYKYATITAYYAAFHADRALIYARGYREKSHYYLIVALQSLLVEKGLLEVRLLRGLHNAMILREEADYHSEFSEEGAHEVITLAKEFIKISECILKRPS